MLEYREFRAPEESPLQCVWELRGQGADRQRITPDGRFEMIVHLGEPLEALTSTGWKRQSAVLIAGQMTRPLFVSARGTIHTVGVRLKSWAAASVVGLPASELSNQIVNAQHVSRGLARQLFEEVQRYRSSLENIATSLRAQMGTAKPADKRITRAVCEIERTQGRCRVEHMAKVSSVSFKQLQRLFDQHVGVGPKTFARIRRFSNVFAQLDPLQPDWAQIAFDCGYSDQSHLIRDFSQFAGAPPAALVSSSGDLAWHFTAAQRNDDFFQD